MSPRRDAHAAIALAVGVVAVALVLTPAASGLADQTGAVPLDQARTAAETTPFVGTMSVEWTDHQGRHSDRLAIQGSGGVLHIDGGGSLVATSDGRMLLQSGGWSLVAPGDPSEWGPAPPITAKYALRSTPGPDIAGRPTTLVDVRTRDGETDERLFLDRATGLVLRREQLEDGLPVRVVAFTSIAIGSPSHPAAPAIARDDRPRRLRPATLPAPFRAPAQLAAGYALVSVLGRKAVIEVVYSDGLHSLSVFEQGGGLDDQRLPRSGDPVTMGTAQGVRYGWPGGQLITWQSGPATFTVVGDAPMADLVAAAASLPPARSLSSRQRIRLTCRQMLEELIGRD